MARNEEKQFGKLNRLWLQKEKEEGRIKVPERPKLSSLNTAPSVKKWIPSIKNEIEYYLQQAQLSHYPERKIAEFHKRVADLEREYKQHIRKLRSLDPTCRHHPWTPRAYAKRRCSESKSCHNSPTMVKVLCDSEPSDHPSLESVDCDGASRESRQDTQPSGTPDPSPSFLSPADLPGQDQPLSFNTDRMPLMLARSQVGSGVPRGDGMTQALLSGLPNLQNFPVTQAVLVQWREVPGAACSRRASQKVPHVLGLGCYWSSDEDT